MFFQIHSLAFRELINLIRLDLSDNALAAVPSAAFQTIPQLRELVRSDRRGQQAVHVMIL
jgi:hypothetical protein